MNIARALGVLYFALMLSGCATPYQASGFRGGVQAVPIGNGVYRVQAALNAYSSQGMVQDYILLRAAETAWQQGAIGFVVLSSQNTSSQSTIITGGGSQTYGSAYRAGNVIQGQSTTTYNPVQVQNLVHPSGFAIIQLVRQPVPEGLQYFRAVDLIGAIRPRVDRSPVPPSLSTPLSPGIWHIATGANPQGRPFSSLYVDTGEIVAIDATHVHAISRTVFAPFYEPAEMADAVGEIVADYDCAERQMRLSHATVVNRSLAVVRQDYGQGQWMPIPAGSPPDRTFQFVCTSERGFATLLPAGMQPGQHAGSLFSAGQ